MIIEHRWSAEWRGRRVWNCHYWHADAADPGDDYQTIFDWGEQWFRGDRFGQLYLGLQTITIDPCTWKARIVKNHPTAWRHEDYVFYDFSGTIITGTQPWQNCMRFRFEANSRSHKPHYWRMGPIPKFGTLFGITEGEYMNRIAIFSAHILAGMVDRLGRTWRLCVRESDGQFTAIRQVIPQLCLGSQRNRQRWA